MGVLESRIDRFSPAFVQNRARMTELVSELRKRTELVARGGPPEAVERLRAAGSGLPIEVESETLDEVREVLEAGADRILLDNMPPALLREAVALVRSAGHATQRQAPSGGPRVLLEASGGVTIDNVRAVAETGVDYISVGALTHSARSLDVSMKVRA